ncbi:MAG TPA: glycosyltransferase family 39 protein [Candidatus Acidoferrales bacterium]|nr:glycosyltransferase family 39 protein [Candidatus Acidoferrales bacterium]
MTIARLAALPRPVPVVLAAALLVSLVLALRLPLLDPDEGRNAEVAREMSADGDVVVPHLAGLPYLDKPPLLFALAALSIRAFGATPLAARLPAMLAALATLLLLARASVRLEPAGHAARATALTAAAPLFAALSAYVIFDMPLTLCVTAVWTGLALEHAEGPRTSRRAAMFAAVALGVLIKGPVMLAWAIGGSVAAACLLRSARALRWLGWAPGWAIVLALAGGWFALALRRHPEYARYAFVEESFERMTSGSFHRDEPWWFVPAVLVGGALPWSLATPWRAPSSVGARVAAGFALFALVFFSLTRSKLVTYLLPALPALAWWAAEAWTRAGAARGRTAPFSPAPLWAGLLGFTPLLVVLGAGPLEYRLPIVSGAPLAAAIARAGGGTVRYEGCYSPGSDYLRGAISTVVSRDGRELTSNYVLRYRDRLETRGEWRLIDSAAVAPPAAIVVRPSAAPVAPGRRDSAFFTDSRFAASRLAR